MNGTSLSLPQVQATYGSKYNLLLPQALDTQINPFYSYRVEIVPVDISEGTGDCFKVGSVNAGKDASGKTIWQDSFSLTKPLLNKMALAAGIQFDADFTKCVKQDEFTYIGYARGAMKKSDGTARIEVDQKMIDLKDEEAKYRIDFMDKAEKGIVDEKQAKAAADIFAGTWIDSVDKWGRKCKAFLIAKEDRDKYIERSVMVNMALLRKTAAEKAMTGAKLRVIRALLGVKGTYTKAELEKGFAIPAVVFSPDYNDPTVRQMMLQQGMASVNNMFGTANIPVKQISFSEPSYTVTDEDLENPAFQSDVTDEDYASDYVQQEPVVEETSARKITPAAAQQTTESDSDYVCEECGIAINDRVWKFSYDKYGTPLCMKCQRNHR